MPRRYYRLQPAPAVPLEQQVFANLMEPQTLPGPTNEDIYGDREPEYQAILLRRLLRAEEAPKMRSPRGMVE